MSRSVTLIASYFPCCSWSLSNCELLLSIAWWPVHWPQFLLDTTCIQQFSLSQDRSSALAAQQFPHLWASLQNINQHLLFPFAPPLDLASYLRFGTHSWPLVELSPLPVAKSWLIAQQWAHLLFIFLALLHSFNAPGAASGILTLD